MSKCANPKCTSGLPATHMPIVLCWSAKARPHSHIPISIDVENNEVCLPCTKTLQPKDFFTHTKWMEICHTIKEAKKEMPSLKTAKMVYVIPETKPSGAVHV